MAFSTRVDNERRRDVTVGGLHALDPIRIQQRLLRGTGLHNLDTHLASTIEKKGVKFCAPNLITAPWPMLVCAEWLKMQVAVPFDPISFVTEKSGVLNLFKYTQLFK